MEAYMDKTIAGELPAVVCEHLGSLSDFAAAARTAARRTADALCWSGIPVFVVQGDQVPTVEGTEHHWETPGGRWVGSSYRWTKNYIPSTLHVLVGADWRPEVW